MLYRGAVLAAMLGVAGCDKLFDINRLEPPDAPPIGTFCEQPAQAGALFCADFDTPDGDPYFGISKYDDGDIPSGSRYELEEADPHTPPRSARLIIRTADARISQSLGAARRCKISVWLNIITTEPPTSFTNVFSFTTGARADNRLIRFNITSDGRVRAALWDTATQSADITTSAELGVLPHGRWFRLEVDVDLDASPFAMISIDGQTAPAIEGAPFVAGGEWTMFVGPFDAMGTGLGWTILADEVVVRMP